MSFFGEIMICVAAVLSAAGGGLAMAGNGSPRTLNSARKLLVAAAAAAIASLLALLFLLLVHDLRVTYVRDYADRTMSIGYLAMALWGGQEGSLLVWAVLQTIFTAWVANISFAKNKELVPVALAFLAFVQVFFLCLALFHSNPFELLGTIAANGVGLNPLLRNPYMAIHPPTLYIGFVGFSVPMAFALAALVERRASEDWLSEIRNLVLFAWAFLSAGNILGMVWAYEELGWGGYWGWDPVENASLMPWLTGTALLHSALVLKKKKRFPIWCLTFAWLTFVLVIFGTFLTRSNMIQSVHAFSGASAGPYFIGLILFVAAFFLTLMAMRRREFIEPDLIESWSYRQWMFFFTNIGLLLLAVIVWVITMLPKLTEIFIGEKVAVTPELYNRFMIPFGLAVLAMIGLCLLVGRKNKSESARRITIALSVAIGTAFAMLVVWYQHSKVAANWDLRPIAAGFIVGFVCVFVVREIIKIIRQPKENTGFSRAVKRRLGAHIIHLSVVLLFIGFTGAAFTAEKTANLPIGGSMRVDRYKIDLVSLREDNTFERYALLADLQVSIDNEVLGIWSPSQHTYYSHPDRPSSEVAIRTTLAEDLFLIVGNVDANGTSAIIRAIVNPLVAWIWIGGAMLIIGACLAFIKTDQPEVSEAKKVNCQRTLIIVTLIAAAGVLAGLIGGAAHVAAVLMGICIIAVVQKTGEGLFVITSTVNGTRCSTIFLCIRVIFFSKKCAK